MAQNAQADESIEIKNLPDEVLDALPDDIRQEILDGARDQIPEDVVEGLTSEVTSQIPDSLVETGVVDAAADNPGVAAVLIVIGLAALGGAIWGAIKGFIKMAVLLGIVALVAWWLFFRG